MTTQTICSHCRGPVSNKGPKSITEARFCLKRECQAAKARLRRQRLRTDRQAPAECSGCGAALTPRGFRSGDEHGRWCNKESCRLKRRTRIDRIEAEVAAADRIPLLENALQLVGDAVMADSEHCFSENRVVCHQCGLTTALKGWIHLTEDGRGCHGTRGDAPIRRFPQEYIGHAWPFRREYVDAETIAKLESD